MTRHSIWIGDLLRAYETLGGSTPEERVEIARSLGLGPTPSPRPAPDLPPPALPEREPQQPLGTVEPADSQPAEEAPDQPDGPDGTPGSRVSVVGYDPPLVTIPDGLTLGAEDDEASPPPHLPLLRPRSTRAVLQALLAQQVEGGDVDVPALVRAVATRRVGGLPHLRRPTLRFGVQVLVDNGEGMAPFAADQDELVEQIRDVVGASRTEVLHFAGTPLRGTGPGPVWTWGPRYRPPQAGTPVLILSDLGLIPQWEPNGSGAADWMAFAGVLRASGVTGTALVPYPAHRWPGWARRLFTMVVWDRSLTAGRAKATRG